MSINRGECSSDGNRARIKTPGGELKDRVDLFARDVELLDDFIDGGAGFEIQEHGGHGHAGIAKHPRTA